jgi:hypothetical protein
MTDLTWIERPRQDCSYSFLRVECPDDGAYNELGWKDR